METIAREISAPRKLRDRLRRTSLFHSALGLALIAVAIVIPHQQWPLVATAALVGAAAAGYFASSIRSAFVLAGAAAGAAIFVWAGDDRADAMQWLGATLALIFTTMAVVRYVRLLEQRAFDVGWRAELADEAADLGMFRWDFATGVVNANAKLRELFFLPPEGPLFGAEVFQTLDKEDAKRVRDAIAAVKDGRGHYREEFRVVSKEGAVRWIAGRGRVINTSRTGAPSLVAINFDTTDLKSAERNQHYLLNGVPALLGIADADGGVLDLNDSARSRFPEGQQTFGGKKIWDLPFWTKAAGDLTRLQESFAAALSGREVSIEARLTTEGDEDGWALATFAPIFDAGDRVTSVVFSAFDITERKLAESRNALLVGELDHRIRNLLSVTNALIGLTAREASSVSQFAEATRRRLAALHDAHNLGARNILRRTANFRDVVETALKPWRTDPPRFHVAGEDFEVDAGVATAWALILYELGARAAEGGALAAPAGSIAFNWADEEEETVFRWREIGGAAGGAGAIVGRLAKGFLGAVVETETDAGAAILAIRVRRDARGSADRAE